MNLEKIKKLVEFDTPTVANGLEMLELGDPSAGYTGPDVRALMPELGPRVGVPGGTASRVKMIVMLNAAWVVDSSLTTRSVLTMPPTSTPASGRL